MELHVQESLNLYYNYWKPAESWLLHIYISVRGDNEEIETFVEVQYNLT